MPLPSSDQNDLQIPSAPSCEEIAELLNKQCHCVSLNREVMNTEMSKWLDSANLSKIILNEHQYFYSESAVFVAETSIRKQLDIVAAVEKMVALPAYQQRVLAYAPEPASYRPKAHGAFIAYDFHLGPNGPKLIEINTNAGGGLINTILARSQNSCCDLAGGSRPGKLPTQLSGLFTDTDPEQAFFEMFLEEWQAEKGQQPLRSIAIVDENPETQYMMPEFLLFKKLFERNSITAIICDPCKLDYRAEGVWYGDLRIDLVYNRLTDFGFEAPNLKPLRAAYLSKTVVITPHPWAHAIYADKRNLSILTEDTSLKAMDTDSKTRNTLLEGIAQTICVDKKNADTLWASRKKLFFKPAKGYGSKAAYRGDKLTRRVFDEIMQGNYVAQTLVQPSERQLEIGNKIVGLKLDIRMYVYRGATQLICARLYQGQTTNFRTPGGGFAQVVIIPCEETKRSDK